MGVPLPPTVEQQSREAHGHRFDTRIAIWSTCAAARRHGDNGLQRLPGNALVYVVANIAVGAACGEGLLADGAAGHRPCDSEDA